MKKLRFILVLLTAVFLIGMIIPDDIVIPVEGATPNDWNHNTFWYEPWGSSVVHKGIDIFGKKGTATLSSSKGLVIYTGTTRKGGNVVAVLGPKWRIHYYAHMDSYSVTTGTVVKTGSVIGVLGDSGNAQGKQPHIHYSILSIIPIPWLATTQTQGWKRMFFLNPHEMFI
ncbi:Membrane protein similar to metalloendopeptidase [Pseudoalteromonas sp. 3J6]|uniref:M23 family metallopeptidase n=1 Tax=Pseudoalteromonas sp. 3J6 TaxID=649161 RepID=UPI00176DA3F4|nr:M23 family metallopeptidase [Pseudoalteromonas sp. 3J6]CAD2223858.1 Membrane protein similar to metalloendopeptidase [Pseudoalteromonas sp. 3J6]